MLLKDVKKLTADIKDLTRRHDEEGLDLAASLELRSKVARASDLLASKRGCSLEGAVRSELEALVGARKAFTAWNVTESLRGRGVYCQHWQVKQVVRRRMESEDPLGKGVKGVEYWNETVLVAPPRGLWAVLYYPEGFDPVMYSGTPVSADEAAPAADDVGDVDDVDELVDDSNDEPGATRYFSRDGQLYVPRAFSTRISEAHATLEGSQIVVGETGDHPLTTDAKGNIRLTRRKIQQMLDAAEGSASAGSASDRARWETTAGCNVSLSGGEIVVRPL